MEDMVKDYLKEVGITISICDREGTIVYLNDKGVKTFSSDGGRDLIGSNLLDCHPEPSKTKLKEMMISHETQSYVIGKGEKMKMIHQTPIYKDGEFDGYIEFHIPLPKGLGSR